MEKFEKDIEEIKTKYNNIKLTDEEKNDLKMKMQEELNKSKVKEKTKTIIFPRRLVATFACFFLIIVSCAAFADEIEDFVKHVFSNTDRKLEQAIANGNYEEINMDYIEKDGIGIKVDYIIKEDDTLYVVFNVRSEQEFATIRFENIKIFDINEKNIFDNKNYKMKYQINKKSISKYEQEVIYRIEINEKIDNNLRIDIIDLTQIIDMKKNIKFGVWTLNVIW